MGIDPVKNNTIAWQVARQTAGTGQRERTFEQLLEEIKPVAGQPQQVGAAASLLALTRLHSLSGLLIDDGPEEGRGFSALSLMPLAVAKPEQAQQVDRLYRQLQPSLRGERKLERADIERMIDQVAEQVSLAPELIRSVVAAESDFQPQAVSHVGAQGLMQLMPETAKELGVEDSFDPQQNLLGGSRYLKQLLDKYEGDLDKALAAYNWGQGNVDRRGLEQMPLETRNYLAKVKGPLAGNV